MQPVPADTTAQPSGPEATATGAPAAARWKEALNAGPRKVAQLLDSGAEALGSLDGVLDDITSQDWTATGVAARLERAASEAVRRRATAVLSRLDHAPVAGVAYGVRLSRAAVQAARSALQNGARRLAPAAAAPAVRPGPSA